MAFLSIVHAPYTNVMSDVLFHLNIYFIVICKLCAFFHVFTQAEKTINTAATADPNGGVGAFFIDTAMVLTRQNSLSNAAA